MINRLKTSTTSFTTRVTLQAHVSIKKKLLNLHAILSVVIINIKVWAQREYPVECLAKGIKKGLFP